MTAATQPNWKHTALAKFQLIRLAAKGHRALILAAQDDIRNLMPRLQAARTAVTDFEWSVTIRPDVTSYKDGLAHAKSEFEAINRELAATQSHVARFQLELNPVGALEHAAGAILVKLSILKSEEI